MVAIVKNKQTNCIKYLKVTRRVDIKNSHHKGKNKKQTNRGLGGHMPTECALFSFFVFLPFCIMTILGIKSVKSKSEVSEISCLQKENLKV